MCDDVHTFYGVDNKHCLNCGRSFGDVIPSNSYTKDDALMIVTQIYICPQCESANSFLRVLRVRKD